MGLKTGVSHLSSTFDACCMHHDRIIHAMRSHGALFSSARPPPARLLRLLQPPRVPRQPRLLLETRQAHNRMLKVTVTVRRENGPGQHPQTRPRRVTWELLLRRNPHTRLPMRINHSRVGSTVHAGQMGGLPTMWPPLRRIVVAEEGAEVTGTTVVVAG